MNKPPTRRALHAYVSDEAHDAWHDFAAENGVSVSGLLEAMTAHLSSTPGTLPVVDAWDEAIKAARVIDARRRRRSV